MQISVIIPTYNRFASLLLVLESLKTQTISFNQFEVIVVDDGSTDAINQLLLKQFPMNILYYYQANHGGLYARNYGAMVAKGELLVFLDDDMTTTPGYLEALWNAYIGKEHIILRGRLLPLQGNLSVFAKIQNKNLASTQSGLGDFTSNNLAIRKSDFLDLGSWRDVSPPDIEHKGGIWSDLEFAYRALQRGFSFFTVDIAGIYHRDYVLSNLRVACDRAYKISKWAVYLLQKYPELSIYVPMFYDKRPIRKEDSLNLKVRKFFRKWASWWICLNLMVRIANVLEHFSVLWFLLRILYRWIIGGYIYNGYHEGLRTYNDQKC
jgi:glycosyltransferase involved in cell wall biosynthesis